MADETPQDPPQEPQDGASESSVEEPFDPERAKGLIEKLRNENKSLREQREPQDERDARVIASLKRQLDEAKPKIAEYDRLVDASKTELERKTEELARWQSEAEKWRTASVASRVEALAAVDFADPSDAVHALDPVKYLDAGGTIDEAAIKADLAELLTRKPHYRRPTDTTPRVPAPNPAQGSGVNGKAAADPRTEFAAILQSGLNRQ